MEQARQQTGLAVSRTGPEKGIKIERPSERLHGLNLPGRRSGKLWSVVKRFNRRSGFSVGYIVQDAKGTRAFLKATDIEFARSKDGEQPIDKLRRIMRLHTYERDMLTICRGNGLDRIIKCLDEGEIEVEREGVRSTILYLIFELASGDAGRTSQSDTKARLRAAHALHQLAEAVGQLHSTRIAHNDIKPANLLFFKSGRHKLADLGRATSDHFGGPYDTAPCLGDRRYAAPELIYPIHPRARTKIPFEQRALGDLYALGSMAYYFLAGQMLTLCMLNMVQSRHPQAVPDEHKGSYLDVLPNWREAFPACISEAASALQRWPIGQALREEVVGAINELCDPDPSCRGRPGCCSGLPRYGVEHYVSVFDRLRAATVAASASADGTAGHS